VCDDGETPDRHTRSCRRCEENSAGINGKCERCEVGQVVNNPERPTACINDDDDWDHPIEVLWDHAIEVLVLILGSSLAWFSNTVLRRRACDDDSQHNSDRKSLLEEGQLRSDELPRGQNLPPPLKLDKTGDELDKLEEQLGTARGQYTLARDQLHSTRDELDKERAITDKLEEQLGTERGKYTLARDQLRKVAEKREGLRQELKHQRSQERNTMVLEQQINTITSFLYDELGEQSAADGVKQSLQATLQKRQEKLEALENQLNRERERAREEEERVKQDSAMHKIRYTMSLRLRARKHLNRPDNALGEDGKIVELNLKKMIEDLQTKNVLAETKIRNLNEELTIEKERVKVVKEQKMLVEKDFQKELAKSKELTRQVEELTHQVEELTRPKFEA